MGEKMFNIVPWRNADSAAARPGAREQSGQACAGEAVGQEAAKPQRRASGRFMQSQPSVRLEAHRPLPGIVPERKEDTCSRAHGAHPLTSFIHRSPKREDTPRPTAGEGPKLQARRPPERTQPPRPRPRGRSHLHRPLCGGRWLPPSTGASGSPAAGHPAAYANCLAVSRCSLNPGQARCEQGSWKRSPGAAGTGRTFALSRLPQCRPRTPQAGLAHAYRPEVTRGRMGTAWRVYR